MSKHWQEILKELHDKTHQDGYFGRKYELIKIVDELVGELTYTNLLKNQEIKKDPDMYCNLPLEQFYGGKRDD